MNQEAMNSHFINDSDIAIIAMSCRVPGANNPEKFWDNLQNGVESVSWFKDEEILAEGIEKKLLEKPNYVKAGAVIEDIDKFDAFFFDINAKEAEIIDPQHRIFLECAYEAIKKAGYNPHNDNQNAIAKIWQKYIGVDQVGIHDNFFDLGGDSLIGLQVVEKLNREFETKLPATTIYKAPTVSTIAQLIEPPEIEEKSTDTRRSRGKRRREKKLRQRS